MKKAKAYIKVNGMTFEVYVLEHKKPYGQDTYKIIPVAGSGEAWVRNVIIKK